MVQVYFSMGVTCKSHVEIISIDRVIKHEIAHTSTKYKQVSKDSCFWPGNGCFVWQDSFSAQVEHNFTGSMAATEM